MKDSLRFARNSLSEKITLIHLSSSRGKSETKKKKQIEPSFVGLHAIRKWIISLSFRLKIRDQ